MNRDFFIENGHPNAEIDQLLPRVYRNQEREAVAIEPTHALSDGFFVAQLARAIALRDRR